VVVKQTSGFDVQDYRRGEELVYQNEVVSSVEKVYLFHDRQCLD
jgi:hypothetical protein